jgi:hypothetical protein
VITPPAFDQFLILPLRVHLLQSDDIPELHCDLSDDDIQRIIGKVNRIWNVAGIHWGLESIRREPAVDLGKYRAARDVSPQGRIPLGLYRMIRPESSREFDGLHVYYLRSFSVNGVYLGSDFAFVQQTAKLREVQGGIDEPLPRVTAHELGHALGLAHRQDRTNLLASGTTGIKLNSQEVEKARSGAKRWRGVVTVFELSQAAEAAARHDANRARQLWSWLSEIPGANVEAIEVHLKALDDRESPNRPRADR